jgi:hypothetical protein
VAEARTLALGLPCALIDIRETQSLGRPARLLVSGPALPGAAFDAFLNRIQYPHDIVIATEPLDPGHCAPLAVMTDLVRHSREHAPLRLIAPVAPVPIGGAMTIATETIPNGALYVDLYATDGSVRHLHRGTVLGKPAEPDITITAAAAAPPGQHLLVAITTATPLNLAQRPESESETAYLPALQAELARLGTSSVQSRAEVAVLSIIPAPRPVTVSSRPPTSPAAMSRVPSPGNPRCQDINARVMVGETLSDADRTILRTSCGR